MGYEREYKYLLFRMSEPFGLDALVNFVHLGLQIYVQLKKHDKSSDEHAVLSIEH